jgi:hypothetical protein
MTAIILNFPSSRCRAVRVERERGDFGWLVLADVVGELHGDLPSALFNARDIAAELGVAVVSSACWSRP